jgi:hypothetical protein
MTEKSMKTNKFLALTGIMAAGALNLGVAMADSDTGLIKLADWINGVNLNDPLLPVANQIIDQDKIWTYIASSDNITNAAVLNYQFQTLENRPIPGDDQHQLDITQILNLGAFTGFLRYSIEIDLGIAPLNVFREASVDPNIPNRDANVTKTYYSDAFGTVLDTLSTNGAPLDTQTVAGLTKIWVNVAFNVGSGQTLNGVSDQYVQATRGLVPEPTTLALLGIGVAGLGWRGRQRKALTRT